eukprot:CAMPEP_0201576044 /NCGR_PEP_ID=MMETSP0190_2-20130828/21619_1 /ASSEMBLY_ACC=CAM_ASM_000263 /TAXON_ID=37353 /ORGANISM="Rosalina sp." /LENGTH=246 /DNA_ID=CAMNT_0048006439 /DNA_START=179 /DNA_END=919 /DNA_ORIENTATION=+
MAETEKEAVKQTEEENKVQKEEEEPANAAEEEENKDKEEEEEEDIYLEALPNRIVVARNRPLSYYVDRSRRILRMEEELYICGRASSISMSCALVEVLKRQKIAEIAQVATGMNVEPFFNRSGDPRWSQPTAMITFKLTRGEFAEYVADFHQRKVIEIFENKDDKQTGILSFDDVEALKMGENFRSNDEQIESSKKFLSAQKEKQLDLPGFIKYASLLIHPLLKDKVFKQITTEYIQGPAPTVTTT